MIYSKETPEATTGTGSHGISLNFEQRGFCGGTQGQWAEKAVLCALVLKHTGLLSVLPLFFSTRILELLFCCLARLTVFEYYDS